MRSLLSASVVLLALILPTPALSTPILTNNGNDPKGWVNDASFVEGNTLQMIWTITNDNPTNDQNITIVSAPHDLTFVFGSGDQLGDVPTITAQGTTCVIGSVLRNGQSCGITLALASINPTKEDGPFGDWDLAAKAGGSLVLTVNFGGVPNFDFTMGGSVRVNDIPEPSSIPLFGAALLGLWLVRRAGRPNRPGEPRQMSPGATAGA